MNAGLRKQIIDAAGNVQFTYVAHLEIVNRLKKRYKIIKIIQIVLTAIAATGFLVSITAGISWLNWIGGLTSAVSLGLNLYMLNFNLPSEIKQHTDAANDLWDVREAYNSLLTDFDSLQDNEIRDKRDRITQEVSRINKAYPGTDKKSFAEAQKDMSKYKFEDGEAEKILNIATTETEDKG